MQDGDGRATVGLGRVDVGERARDPDVTVVLERRQAARCSGRERRRLGVRHRRRELDLEYAIVALDLLPVIVARGRREDGEDRASDSPFAHPGQIEVTLGPAVG